MLYAVLLPIVFPGSVEKVRKKYHSKKKVCVISHAGCVAVMVSITGVSEGKAPRFGPVFSTEPQQKCTADLKLPICSITSWDEDGGLVLLWRLHLAVGKPACYAA